MRRGGKSGQNPSDTSSNSRAVNNLLHNLRGEHFRQERNRTIRDGVTIAHPPSHYVAPDFPSLPISQIFGEKDVPDESDAAGTLNSWTIHTDIKLPSWRREALSLLFTYAPLSDDEPEPPPSSWIRPSPEDDEDRTAAEARIPPLVDICLQALVRYCHTTSSFADDLVPYLLPHLRRRLLRWSAVHAPLSNMKLYALCEKEMGGHADGELVVVGPWASLPTHYFKSPEAGVSDEASGSASSPPAETSMTVVDSDSWDSSNSTQDEPPPLLFLTLLSVSLPVQTLFAFPPTITHLALLAIPALTPIHRLPRLLPNLEVLDLSYNVWLGQPKIISSGSKRGENLIERTEWGRWSRLKVLGLRGCGIGQWVVKKVNVGRWVDVDVIGVVAQGIQNKTVQL